MPEVVVGDRIVVSGYSPGSHFPRTEAMIPYLWEAWATKDHGPYAIAGSVYGRQLRFTGPGAVSGTVLGRGDVTLNAGGKGLQRFLSGVAANGNIGTEPSKSGLRDSLVGDIRRASYVIRGDVLANNILLENAIVFGNVHGLNVTLQHCVVVGAAVAKEQLRLVGSTVLYYHCRDVQFEGPCALMHAMGESVSRPRFLPYEDAVGEVWSDDVRYYPMLRAEGDRALSNRPWSVGQAQYDGAKLYPEHDWVAMPVSEVHHRPVQGKMQAVEVPSERYVLSLGRRMLNLQALGATLTDIYTLLKSGLEFGHYAPAVQHRTYELWRSLATPDELWILQQATESVAASGEA